jgi:hypothetical protein
MAVLNRRANSEITDFLSTLRGAWHTDGKCFNEFLDWEHVADMTVVWMIVVDEGRGGQMSVYGPR